MLAGLLIRSLFAALRRAGLAAPDMDALRQRRPRLARMLDRATPAGHHQQQPAQETQPAAGRRSRRWARRG